MLVIVYVGWVMCYICVGGSWASNCMCRWCHVLVILYVVRSCASNCTCGWVMY